MHYRSGTCVHYYLGKNSEFSMCDLSCLYVQAVKSGTWIILENLDAAPMDVVKLKQLVAY